MSGGIQPVRRGKKSQVASDSGAADEVDELSKEETKIARHLRLNCPKKQGNLLGMKVDFFVANKLVDCLLESKWGPAGGKNASPVLGDRRAAVAFMQRLMNKQLFYRAVKIYKESANTDDKVHFCPSSFSFYHNFSRIDEHFFSLFFIFCY